MEKRRFLMYARGEYGMTPRCGRTAALPSKEECRACKELAYLFLLLIAVRICDQTQWRRYPGAYPYVRGGDIHTEFIDMITLEMKDLMTS